ncbi:MAG: tRNA lysidine(34) synthetase TilS [bacterium]
MNLQERFLDNFVNKCRIQPGRVLVAVSGGPDSVALLHLLLEVHEQLQIEPVVAHVNHSLRQEADDDEAFCRQLTEQRDLLFVVRPVDTKAFAKAEKMSIETAARELRYQALHEMAQEQGCIDILLGHTANDQSETVLHNLSRGAGIRGLAGMPFRHGKIVRPLLTIYKNEILEYLDEHKIAYQKDSTNRELIFRRNVIRHRVMPELEKSLNPQITEAFCRISEISHEAEVFIDAMAKMEMEKVTKEKKAKKIILDIERISGYFPILRKYIIRNSLEALSDSALRPDFDMLSRTDQMIMAGKIGKRVQFSNAWELLIDHDGIVIWNGGQPRFDFICNQNEAFKIGEKRTFKYTFLSTPPSPNRVESHDNFTQYVDANKVKGQLHIRSVKAGDRFYPLGLNGSKSVSDLFTDRKIPLHQRSEVPVVACDAGIVWVVGLHLDDRFKVTNRTNSFLLLEIKEADL